MPSETPARISEQVSSYPPDNVYELSYQLEQEEAEAYWGIVSSGFESLNNASLLKQDMTRDEFMHDMQNPDVLKFKAYADDKPAALFTVHTKLEDISWVNSDQLLHYSQGTTDENRRLYYVGTLVVSPDNRGLGQGLELLRYLRDWFGEDNEASGGNTLVFFDHGMQNAALPGLIGHAFRTDQNEPSATCFDMNRLGSHVWSIETVEPSAGPTEHLDELQQQLDENAINDYYAKYVMQFKPDVVAKPMGKAAFTALINSEEILKLTDGACFAIIQSDTTPDHLSRQYIGSNYGGKTVNYMPVLVADASRTSQFMASIVNKLGKPSEQSIYIHDLPLAQKRAAFDDNSRLKVNSAVGEEQSVWVISGKQNDA